MSPLGLLLAALMGAALLGAAGLLRSARRRRLRERVRAVAVTAEAPPALPSIRVEGARHGALALRMLRLLRFDPELRQAYRLPWPVVALIGAAVALLSGARLAGYLGPVLATPAGLLSGLLAARAVFGWQRARYCDAVFRQIPDALGLMVRAVRAGLPLAEAIRGIGREMPQPTGGEFARVVGEMAIGGSVDAALMRLAARTRLTEYAFLAVTLGLQSQTGGSLAETLENLAQIVRKRVMLAKRAKALAAEARMQAGLLVVLPFIAALAMSFIQPFYLRTFTETATGQRMAMVGLGLMGLGLLTIRWLIRQAGRD